MPGAPARCDEEHAARLITESLDAISRGRGLFWAIVRRRDGVILGEVTLDLRSGELAFWLGSAFRGKGYAREAVTEMLDRSASRKHGFRIRAYAHRDNARSLRLLEHCGFRFAGLRRDHPAFEGHPMLEYQWVGPDREKPVITPR